MQLILLQKVVNLGDLGDKVDVTPGYGRNFLVPQGKAVPATEANLAQFESALIGERVKAGMARAKAQGKRTSRPPIPEATRTKIAELYAQGTSINRIAKELRIAYGTAWNYTRGAVGTR